MKAAFYEGHRSIRVGACKARAPGAGEVRIEVACCGVCGTDLHIFQGHMEGRVRPPQVMGHEMSGRIAEVGAGVRGWSEGERVVVRPLVSCGACAACRRGHEHICHSLRVLGVDAPGAFQASWTVPAQTLHRLPEGVRLEHAAMIEPVAVACHDLRMGEVTAGEFVVVLGGGPIGMLIALAARQRGARVVVSEINPFRIKLARELGLEAVDARAADLEARVGELTEGAGADVVFEVSGAQGAVEAMTAIAAARGRIVQVAIVPQPARVDLMRIFLRELRTMGARVYEPADFEEAIALVASGTLPLGRLITGQYGLGELGRAFEEMERGGEVMKILIDPGGD